MFSKTIDLIVNGGTPGYSYNWSTGNDEEDVDTLFAANYSVTVVDTNGCSETITTTLTEPIAPVAISESHIDVDCFGAATGSIDVTASGGTPPYTYLWSNSATTEDLSGLTPGSYSVIVTDFLGCTEFLPIEITEPLAPLSMILSATDVLCYGYATGSIDALVSGGTAPYTFLWSNGETTEDIANIPAGNYSLLMTDENFCTYSLSLIHI